jgi:hypothetical protein
MIGTDTGNTRSVTADFEKPSDKVFHRSQISSRMCNESVSDGKHVRLNR